MQLEQQIRDTLAGEAARIPSTAIERLCDIDYDPRVHVPPPWLAGGLVGCVAAGAGAVLAFGGSGTQTAFAGWSATPTVGTAAQATTADAECANRLAGASRKSLSGKLEPEVTDTRGPYTLVVYEQATCVSGPGFVGVHGGNTGARVSISTGDRSGQLFTIAVGPAASDASAVTLSLEDGSHVQATVANSRYAAWWPGASRPVSVAISTPSGTKTEQLSFPPPPAMPAAKAAGGADQSSLVRSQP